MSCCTSGSVPCPKGKFAGICVYYSGSYISGPGITNGDDFNAVVLKLANYIAQKTSTTTSTTTTTTTTS